MIQLVHTRVSSFNYFTYGWWIIVWYILICYWRVVLMSVGGNICYVKFWLTHWGGATVLVVYNMRVTLTESSVFYCDSSMFFANIHNVLRYTCRCLPVCYLFMQSWDVPVCLLLSSISDYIVNQVTWWEYYHSNRYVIHPLRDEWSWHELMTIMLVFNDFDDVLNDLLYVYDLYMKPHVFEEMET